MQRLECLDGLRGLLAVYVMFGHLAPFAALPWWVQSALSHGGAAVNVFFVLSGLVIVQSLDACHSRAAPFLIGRVTRIFPAYVCVLAVAVAVQPLPCGFESMPWIGDGSPARSICSTGWPSNAAADIAAHLTMTHGLIPSRVMPDAWVSFLGSAWSLSTEWQFYAVALAVGRLRDSGARRPDWMVLIAALFGLVVIGRLLPPGGFSRAFLAYQGHFFALGVVSVGIVRAQSGAIARYAIVLGLTLMICGMEGAPGKLLPPLVWSVCLAAQMRPAVLTTLARVLRSRLLRYLGSISYCVYLTNEPVQKVFAIVMRWIVGGDPLLFAIGWLPGAVALPLVISMVLHRWVERPAQDWGRSAARSIRANRHGKAGWAGRLHTAIRGGK